ncbi:hypothetical protein [Streptomyces hesseae]|uniref:Secreted protein n=1 Tax=Streptomyces hesseae TaxID=3075519 RepID=A0ABU2T0U0_9ACTN|nr:hypothetical protein [Streptomyces sp. DSM 40473]MDT0453810.1 hypothetical protein [Streptomyces sp. DSM 40473]
MLKVPRVRRVIAVPAAILAFAGGATVTAAGTASAQADTQYGCALQYQGNTDGSPWYGWGLKPCIVKSGYDGSYYAYVMGMGGSTDVRVYVGVYNSCTGVTSGMNGDSDANHFVPAPGLTHYLYGSDNVNISCSSGVWAIARLFESGHGSPWAWSERLN